MGLLYHCAVEGLIPVYITVKYGESQANSSCSLKTWGYNDMTRELRVIGGNDNLVPEDTAILMKI